MTQENGSPSKSSSPKGERSLLENPFVGSLVVPIAIVLVGALIVFGVTKMLSTERSYQDLVREMKSKTFGNRWIAAYELSKLINNSRIPEKDVPWLVENLTEVYETSVDLRTKDFIVVALGSLRTPLALPTIKKALELETDPNIVFHAIVALGNTPKDLVKDWSLVIKHLDSADLAWRQAAILALCTHRVKEAEEKITSLLTSDEPSIRYAAATGLINFRNEKSLENLSELLTRDSKPLEPRPFNEVQVIDLKLNALSALQREQWPVLLNVIEKVSVEDKNEKVRVIAKQVLNQLKN